MRENASPHAGVGLDLVIEDRECLALRQQRIGASRDETAKVSHHVGNGHIDD